MEYNSKAGGTQLFQSAICQFFSQKTITCIVSLRRTQHLWAYILGLAGQGNVVSEVASIRCPSHELCRCVAA